MRVLAGLLRVAVGLDRSRDGVVRKVAVEVGEEAKGGRKVLIVLDTGGRDAELELYSAEARKDLLEDALDVEVELTLAGDAEAAS